MSTATKFGRRGFLAGVAGSVAWLGSATAKASIAPRVKSPFAEKRRDLIMKLPDTQIRALGGGIQDAYIILARTGHWQLKLYGDKTSSQQYQMLLRISFTGTDRTITLDDVFVRGSADKANTLSGHSVKITKHFHEIRQTSIQCC